MTVEDGGATFSLIVCGQFLTLDEHDLLKSLDGVDKILVGNSALTVVFKVDSFLDITASTIIDTQQAVKKTLRNINRSNISSSDFMLGVFGKNKKCG